MSVRMAKMIFVQCDGDDGVPYELMEGN